MRRAHELSTSVAHTTKGTSPQGVFVRGAPKAAAVVLTRSPNTASCDWHDVNAPMILRLVLALELNALELNALELNAQWLAGVGRTGVERTNSSAGTAPHHGWQDLYALLWL